jgi:hypothetical protein
MTPIAYPAEWLLDVFNGRKAAYTPPPYKPFIEVPQPYKPFIEVPQPKIPILFYSSAALVGLVILLGDLVYLLLK